MVHLQKFTKDRVRLLSFFLLGFALLTVLTAEYLPPGIDWRDSYRPAVLKLAALQNPYKVSTFFNPPWALIPLFPFAFLPENLGRSALFLSGLAVFGYAIRRMGAPLPASIAFLLSPPVVHSLLNSNIDWLPILGFVLPPWLGLFFVLIKPQMGFAVAIFWFIESWQRGRIREVARVFWPVTSATVLSFLLFGFWPMGLFVAREYTASFNASVWPWGLPIGITLFFLAIGKKDIRFAMGAGPFVSPVVLFHAWSGALASLAKNKFVMIATVCGLWLLVVFQILFVG